MFNSIDSKASEWDKRRIQGREKTEFLGKHQTLYQKSNPHENNWGEEEFRLCY